LTKRPVVSGAGCMDELPDKLPETPVGFGTYGKVPASGAKAAPRVGGASAPWGEELPPALVVVPVVVNPLGIDCRQGHLIAERAQHAEPVVVEDEQIVPPCAAIEVRDHELVHGAEIPAADPVSLEPAAER